VEGFVNISFVNKVQDQTIIVLDNKNLVIHKVTNAKNANLNFVVQSEHPLKIPIGTPVVITYDRKLNKDEKFNVILHFSTTELSSAIQWVDKENTISKVNKFMYMQCEPILCRTFFPSQVQIEFKNI